MTTQYIMLDTNCLANFLNGEALETSLVGASDILISEITEMEIQCSPNLTSSERKILRQFLDGITIVRLSDKIRELTVKTRLTTRMKLMDAIIVATSQYLKVPILTCDADFEPVKPTTVILLPVVKKR